MPLFHTPAPAKTPEPADFVDFNLGTGYHHNYGPQLEDPESDDFHVRQTTLSSLMHIQAPRPDMDNVRPAEMSLSALMKNGPAAPPPPGAAPPQVSHNPGLAAQAAAHAGHAHGGHFNVLPRIHTHTPRIHTHVPRRSRESTPPLTPRGGSADTNSPASPVTPSYAERYVCQTQPFSVRQEHEREEHPEHPGVPGIPKLLPALPISPVCEVPYAPPPPHASHASPYASPPQQPHPPPHAPHAQPPPAHQLSLAALDLNTARTERPPAQHKASLTTTGKTPLEGTFHLDPCLAQKLFNVPRTLSSTTDATLSGLSAYDDGNFNWVTGAPINGVAKLAKRTIFQPDAKFSAENGGVSLRLAVVDETGDRESPSSGSDTPGKTKKRTTSRVAVSSNRGGIDVDILEIHPERQLDLCVESGAGDVLVLIPETFLGNITVTAPAVHWGSALQPALNVKADEGKHTANVIPISMREAAAAEERAKGRSTTKKVSHGWSKIAERVNSSTLASTAVEYGVGKLGNYIPAPLQGMGEYVEPLSPVVREGYSSFTRGRSRIAITSAKGTVMVGYVPDREGAARFGMRVGVASKQKGWFRSAF